MTVLPPERGQPRFNQTHESAGKPAAMIVWALFLLALPSANLLAIVGMLVAFSARGGATGVARRHLDHQLKLFWTSAVINIVLTGLCMVGIVSLAMDLTQAAWLLPLTVVSGLALIGLTLWFTVRSAIGALNLARDRAPERGKKLLSVKLERVAAMRVCYVGWPTLAIRIDRGQ